MSIEKFIDINEIKGLLFSDNPLDGLNMFYDLWLEEKKIIAGNGC